MGVLDEAKAALQAVSSELTTQRTKQKAALQRLAEIDGQINALRNAPLSLKDFLSYIDHFVTTRGTEYGHAIRLREWIRPNRGSGYDNHIPLNQQPWSKFEDEDGTLKDSAITLPDASALNGGRDAFGAWCFFAPEVVAQKLKTQLQQVAAEKWAPPDAPPVAERRALMAQLELDRESVEKQLESVTQSIAEISGVLSV